MRTLCLVPKSPWPADNGGRQRLVALLRALEERGAIDLVVAAAVPAAEEEALRAAFPDARVLVLGELPRHRLGRWRWVTRRDLPTSVGRRDLEEPRAVLRRFAAEAPAPYDAIWVSGAPTMYGFGKAVRGVPTAVDFADVTWVLEDQVRRRALDRSTAGPTAGPTVGSTARRLRTFLRASSDTRRWERFERHQATRAHLVTVCSEDDRDALGVPGAVVVPNGYARPPRPLGRVEVGAPPRLLLAGQLTYAPNADGASWFVREVLPQVRRAVPGAVVDLVGRPDDAVRALADRDGVVVHGYAEDLDAHLARADAVVVPLRRGSGTRVKIVEAFAHRLPVVSTRLGASGLGVVDGREVLLADTADAFAAAVARVLVDDGVRGSLVDAGTDRFDRDFDWATITPSFADRMEAMVAAAGHYEVLLGHRRTRRDPDAP